MSNIKDYAAEKFMQISNLLKPVEQKKSIQDSFSERQIFRQFEDLKELEDAIATAQNIHNPQRVDLHRILDRIEQDPHLDAQWQTRKMKTVEREFMIVDANEEKNDDLTDLFNQSWFFEFMHLALDSFKRGYELISFGRWNGSTFLPIRDGKGKLHKPVSRIPYRHVQPEFGELLKNDTDYRGLDVFSPPLNKQTLFIGKPDDWGFLFKCAEYVLIKHNAILNWSEWAEIFAHDVRIGKTDAEGAQRNRFVQSLKKMGSAGYGVFNREDEIEYIGTSRQDAFQVYKELLDYIDKNISEVIFGQNVVMNQTGRVLGTAAENITDLYGEHDAKFLQFTINSELLPKLRNMGVPIPDAFRFKWDTSESLSLKERAEIDSKIALMGKTLTNEYLEDTYGVELEDVNIADPEAVANKLRNSYGLMD